MLIKAYGPVVVPVDTVYQIMQLEDRKRALEGIVNRIDQTRILCQGKPELLKNALADLYPKFTERAAAYQSFVIRMGGSAQDIQAEIEQCVTIQDAILAALAGDKGAALNAIEWRGELTFGYQINMPGRPAGMSEERQALAKLARAMRKQHSGNWWQIAKRIIQRLEAAPQRTMDEEWAYNRLMDFCGRDEKGNWYVSEKRAVGRFLSDLVQEFQKLLSVENI